MTPHELAEKIFIHLYGKRDAFWNQEHYVLIESLLTEALAEAVLNDRMKRTADDLYKLSRISGYEEGLKAANKVASCDECTQKAYEECAKICDDSCCPFPCDCARYAEKIRQRAKELK